MNNIYNLKMFQRGFETLSAIISAYSFLMEVGVGAICEVDSYNQFYVKDDAGNLQDFSTTIEHGQILIYFGDAGLIVSTEKITFISMDDEEPEFVIFEVPNPNDIINEETFFQASTIADLSSITNGHLWFTTIMDSYAKVSDFMESDDV